MNAQHDVTSDFITEKELAERWRLRVQTLRVRRGKHPQKCPPFFKFANGAVRYRMRDIEAFEAANMHGPEVVA